MHELFLDSDVLADHLVQLSGNRSILPALLGIAMCFTSVLQATELIAATSHPDERRHAMSVLGSVHVLGFHQRYATTFGDLHRSSTAALSLRMSMTAGMCLLNRLPLVTFHPQWYQAYDELAVVDAAQIDNPESWSDVEQHMTKISRGSRT